MGQSDNRRDARHAISHIAHVATGLGPPLRCKLSDISATGARIECDDPHSSPQEFLIFLNERLPRWCKVMWRSENEIGILFVEMPKSLTAVRRDDGVLAPIRPVDESVAVADLTN